MKVVADYKANAVRKDEEEIDLGPGLASIVRDEKLAKQGVCVCVCAFCLFLNELIVFSFRHFEKLPAQFTRQARSVSKAGHSIPSLVAGQNGVAITHALAWHQHGRYSIPSWLLR